MEPEQTIKHLGAAAQFALRTPSLLAIMFLAACGGAGAPTVPNSAPNGGGPVVTAQPQVTLASNPSTVVTGQSTTLTWSSSNVTSCAASGAWSGTQPVSGTFNTGALSSSATYTLTCTGTGGNASQSATVSVSAAAPPPTAGLACSATSGPLVLKANAARNTAISPFLVFFDATGTTDSSISANTTAFQDVTYTWNFGDTGASGTGTWPYGANAGRNSRNAAMGGVAAHLYITSGTDTAYTVTVTANDGTNTASCQLGVTAYDPNGANGFPGSATTCYFNTSVGSGCPAGATQTSSSVIVAGNVSGKRLLYQCGDTFTSNGVTVSGTKGQIGAYGSCVGTTSNRPIFKATAIVDGLLTLNNPSTDIRITDIAFDGNCGSPDSGTLPCTTGVNGGTIILDNQNGGSINSGNKPFQYTIYNVDAKNEFESYMWSAGGQMAIIQSTAQAVFPGCGFNCINVRPNVAGVGNGAVIAGTCTGCQWTSSGPSEDYGALLGNMFTNGVAGNNTAEIVRVPYMSKFVISDNSLINAGPAYAALKLHNLSYNNNVSNGGSGVWNGTYNTQYNVISDNYFAGSSGANLVEVSPQNPQSDERLRYSVFERNLFAGTESDGRQILVSGTNISVRDNVFQNASGSFGVQVAQRGIEPPPKYVQVYNNTCYGGGSAACVAFNTSGTVGPTPVANSWAENNLIFNGGVVADSGSGNTVSNNTTATSNDPGFINGSGNFSLISDFQPTANYSGGTSVPVLYDALGTAWAPTWDLGAVHH